MLFFFSSRRRHTRCSRDWSSDVCSSDLARSWSPSTTSTRRTCSTWSRSSRRASASRRTDRKSTRLNSSHGYISYAVFCLKKKKKKHDALILVLYEQIDLYMYPIYHNTLL